jgi:hypothetical protein
LPRLGELQTSDTPPPPSDLTRGPTVNLRITRLDMPASQSLRDVQTMLDQQGVAPPLAPVWLHNGMFVRTVTRSELATILDATPPPHSAYRTIMTASDLRMPLDYNRVIGESQSQACTIVLPDDTVEQLTFVGGRVRFLIDAAPQDDGSALISITPQHHKLKASVVPRPLTEKQLDGRIFEPLRLQVRLDADHYLVIMPDIDLPPPPAPPDELQPASAGVQVTDEDVQGDAEADAQTSDVAIEPARPVGDLGRLLLYASRDSEQLRYVVVIDLN